MILPCRKTAQIIYTFAARTTNKIKYNMKILHTSDWHLGHSLYSFDRTEEQLGMLNQMVEIVKNEQPDVFLLAGDVFHTPQPSSTVQTMFTEALVKIHHANEGMTIVVISGNHDSGTRHEIFRTPWRALNVHTIGNINKENIEDIIIEVPGKGYIVAVPYTYERNLPEGFYQSVLDMVSEKNTNGLPVVMAAHTTVRGCDFKGHDQASEYVVGGIDSIDINELGNGYDYIALGHIHHEQFVDAEKKKVRYCGSPIAVSFDECYSHSVSIVEIGQHGDTPNVRQIEIENKRPLVTLPTEGFASWNEAMELLKKYPDNIPAYIRLNVEIEDFLPPESNNEAVTLTKDKQCRFCRINPKRKDVAKTEDKVLTVQELQSENPIEIAKKYASDTNVTFDEEMEALFNEVLKLVDAGSSND